jgi:hypothetical protein
MNRFVLELVTEFCAEICEHSKYVKKHLRKKNDGIRIMQQGAT